MLHKQKIKDIHIGDRTKDIFGLGHLVKVTKNFQVISPSLMLNDAAFDLNLPTDTFKACKLIQICWLCPVSVFDASDLCLLFN